VSRALAGEGEGSSILGLAGSGSFALRILTAAAACALLVPCIGLAYATPSPLSASGLPTQSSASERARIALPNAEPPLASARLVGRFHVTTRVVRVKGMWNKVGEKSETAWALVPQCPQGACSTRAVFTYVSRETKKKLTVRILLERDGAAYTGRGVGPMARCSGQQVRGNVTIRLTARHGEMISTV
jgi:hypothetical protein